MLPDDAHLQEEGPALTDEEQAEFNALRREWTDANNERQDARCRNGGMSSISDRKRSGMCVEDCDG